MEMSAFFEFCDFRKKYLCDCSQMNFGYLAFTLLNGFWFRQTIKSFLHNQGPMPENKGP